MIGMWGMGGIGKTTLATALYVKLCSRFEGHCFLANVRERSEKCGLDVLHNELVSKLLDEKNLHLDVPKVEPCFVISRLSRKKVLIVLDDVATSEQLENLILDYKRLGAGSRVIVTTRDKHIFKQVDGIYKVMNLNFEDSLQLLCLKAFGEKHPENEYEKLLQRAVAYCQGNPLALTMLGADLHSRSKEVWESKLKKLQRNQDAKIYNVLKLSFDDLDRSEQDIFLDIACFFKGESRIDVQSLLESFNFFPAYGIQVLLDKSLITISSSGTLEMHDLIQEMGWEIVQQESIKNPGRRSRLWEPEEVCDVLKYSKGTDVVEGMVLDLSKINEDLYLSSDSFAKMTNMRFLKIHYGHKFERFNVYFPKDLKSLSHTLRYLRWDGFSLASLPPTFCAEKVVQLDMPNGNLKKLWHGVQNLVNLETIDLHGSQHLVKIPDLSKAANLQTLNLGACKSLRQLHPSTLSLPKLRTLKLQFCKKLESLVTEVHLQSLEYLYLDNCSSLKNFSVTSEKLGILTLSGTAIVELPSSFWRNRTIWSLSLHDCKNLGIVKSKLANDPGMGSVSGIDLSRCTKLNASNLRFIFAGLQSLKYLDLEDCSNLETLPDNIDLLQSLRYIYLSRSSIKSLPTTIKNLSALKKLVLDGCGKLVSLPKLPPSLQVLDALNCTSLDTDLTQQLVLEHMLQRIPYLQEHQPKDDDDRYGKLNFFIFPGAHVSNKFRFLTMERSITIPYLSKSDLLGFIYCIIYPNRSIFRCTPFCSIYENGVKDHDHYMYQGMEHIISDHVMISYDDISNFNKRRKACDHYNNISFRFSVEYEGIEDDYVCFTMNDIIKHCGCMPLTLNQGQENS